MSKYYVDNESVLKLIKSYKTLSEDDQKKKKEEIVNLLSYLIFSRTKGYKSKVYYEDLLQEAKMGLLKALDDFDINRGVNFFKFAIWKIQHKINMYLNNHKRFMKKPIDKKDKSKVLKKEISRLSEIESRVITMRFGIFGSEKHTLKQVGKKFNVSKQYIQQLEARVIKKLRNNKNIKDIYVR